MGTNETENLKNQKRLLCTTQYQSNRKPRRIALFSRKIQNKTPQNKKHTWANRTVPRAQNQSRTYIVNIWQGSQEHSMGKRESLQ